MAGQLYLTVKSEEVPGGNISLENVENISVAPPFLIWTFTDGTTVFRKAEDFHSVQFTPYPKDDGEQQTEGPSGDDAGA
jgi:hypothetical protein